MNGHGENKTEDTDNQNRPDDINNYTIETDNYLLNFTREIRSLSNIQKMPQIGIEPHVLGIRDDVIPIDKINSLFSDFTFDYIEHSMKKQEWSEFCDIQNPSTIMKQFPDTTLFFIFYCQIKDEVQKDAHETLLERGWEYSNNIWTKIENNEKFFFDLKSWSKRKKLDK